MKGCISCKHADPALCLEPVQVDCAKLGRRVDGRRDGCEHWNSCKSLKEQIIEHWQRMHDDAPAMWKMYGEAPQSPCSIYCSDFHSSICKSCPITTVINCTYYTQSPYENARICWVTYRNSGWRESSKWDWLTYSKAMIKYLKETL